MKGWHPSGGKSTSLALSSNFGSKEMAKHTKNISGICYYKVLVENETMNIALPQEIHGSLALQLRASSLVT